MKITPPTPPPALIKYLHSLAGRPFSRGASCGCEGKEWIDGMGDVEGVITKKPEGLT
jgi:hypothetical protein